MPLIKALKAHPQSILCLPEGQFSYLDLLNKSELISKAQGPVIFTPEWTLNSLATIVAASRDRSTLVLLPVGAIAPSSIPDHLKSGYLILRTSGSEGLPKWVAHEWSSMIPGLPLDKKITHLAAALMPAHAAGLEILMGAFSSGVTLSLGEGWKDKGAELKPDAVAGPPQQLGLWLATKNPLLDSLKIYYSCADAMQPIWIKKKEQICPNLEIIQVYGCTEGWQAPTETHPSKPWLIKFTDASWFITNKKVQITGPRLAKFWLYSDGTFVPIEGPYFLGDEAEQIEGEYFQVCSARHEVANFWGQKINLIEIESKLLELTGVIDATAVARYDPLAGESLTLELVIDQNTSQDLMRTKLLFLDSLIPKGSWVPRFVGNVSSVKKRRHTRS